MVQFLTMTQNPIYLQNRETINKYTQDPMTTGEDQDAPCATYTIGTKKAKKGPIARHCMGKQRVINNELSY